MANSACEELCFMIGDGSVKNSTATLRPLRSDNRSEKTTVSDESVAEGQTRVIPKSKRCYCIEYFFWVPQPKQDLWAILKQI